MPVNLAAEVGPPLPSGIRIAGTTTVPRREEESNDGVAEAVLDSSLGLARRPASALTIQWIRDASALEPLAHAWRELEATVRTRTVLSTFDYNVTWYRHYAGSSGGDALVGVARRGSTVVGVAPFVVRTRRIGRVPLTCVEFVPHEAYAGEFLVEDDSPETIAAFVESLATQVRFDVLCLNDVDLTTERFAPLRRTATQHRLGVEVADHPNAMVDLRAGYDSYLASRSAHFRQAVRRHARRIEDVGPSRIDGVVLTRGVDGLDGAVERMIAVTEASHKLNGARLADIHRAFLSELAQRFGPRGMLALPILRIGDGDAAFVYGLVERGCFYDITLSYDERFAHLRPGTHLIQELLKELAPAGVRTVVSHGAHEYKQHWATAFTPSPRVFLFSRGVRAIATRLLRFRLRALWRQLGSPEP